MRILFDNPNSVKHNAIQGGPVEGIGQVKYEHVFAPTDTFQLFGFDTTFDDDTSAFTTFQVVNYAPAEFTRLKDIIRTSDDQIAATEVNIQAAKDGQKEWAQI